MPAARAAAEDLAVVLDREVVAAPFLGFDARPIDAQPVVGEPVLRVQLEVLGEARAESVAVAARRNPARAFPRVPVGCGAAPSACVADARGAPPES